MPTLTTGEIAPDFDLTGADGNKYTLREARAGGPVLLVFFKVSCPTCQFTLPFIERLHQQTAAAAGRVLGISQDGEEESRRFAQKFGLSFPLLIDEKPYAVSKQYRLKFVPTLFLIAPDGQIQATCDGFSKPDLTEMQGYLSSRLALPPQPLFRSDERVPQYKPG
ncbi:MAG TPA: TlpA disulfide reductase family protein [Terriglobia bacterium]|nr:TlpA disulfide reductase family protein [Terriglobia bacterium]